MLTFYDHFFYWKTNICLSSLPGINVDPKKWITILHSCNSYNPVHGYIPPTCAQLILSRNNSELFPRYIPLSVCKLRPTFRISTVKRLKLQFLSISVYSIVHNFQYYTLLINTCQKCYRCSCYRTICGLLHLLLYIITCFIINYIFSLINSGKAYNRFRFMKSGENSLMRQTYMYGRMAYARSNNNMTQFYELGLLIGSSWY